MCPTNPKLRSFHDEATRAPFMCLTADYVHSSAATTTGWLAWWRPCAELAARHKATPQCIDSLATPKGGAALLHRQAGILLAQLRSGFQLAKRSPEHVHLASADSRAHLWMSTPLFVSTAVHWSSMSLLSAASDSARTRLLFLSNSVVGTMITYFLLDSQINFAILKKIRIRRLSECFLSAGENLVQTHCVDQEDLKNMILSMESQELSIRNKVSE